MADSVVSGWVDNRVRNHVQGELRLLGRPDPVRLELTGNACPDLAGCRVDFINPRPCPGDPLTLAGSQQGRVGDLTAARKCRVYDVPLEEVLRLADAGQPAPEHLANTLYLEWFSAANGRVVIESTTFTLTMSERAWTLSPEEDAERDRQVRAAMGDFMADLERGRGEDAPEDPDDDGPMDEFEAEAFLREGDQRSERYRIALEKYRNHPDEERLVAREMGWTWIEDHLDADARGLFEEDKRDGELEETLPELEPDPLTEGRDWIRDEDGRPEHPLALRARTLGVALWKDLDGRGLFAEGAPPDALDLASSTHCMAAKLAGALNGLGYRDDPDTGLLIAWTKRAMPFLNAALSAAQRLRDAGVVPADVLDGYTGQLLAVRDEILALLQRYRDGR